MCPSVVQSVYNSQSSILASICKLHCPQGFDADLTYGNGKFYSDETGRPEHRFDLDGSLKDLTAVSCSTSTPLKTHSIESAVFDPPFLTYVRQQRTGNGNMIMSKRFSGYWRYDELKEHYENTAQEAARILKQNGVFVVKCQDIVHNHALHPTHINMVLWCAEHGLSLLDTYVQVAKHRLPSPNRAGKQKHARIFHSYFLVFKNTLKTPTTVKGH